MPTPIGHSLISTAFFSGINRKKLQLNWFDYLVFLFIGIFPDLDFLPGLILGTPSRFHHGFTHSIFFGIVIGTITGLLYSTWKRKHWLNYCLVFTGVYFSHLIADFFGVDTSFPYGEQLFWPLWQAYLLSPISIFLDVYRSSVSEDFFVSMFNLHNLKTVIIELFICIPILFLINYKHIGQGK
ncbi:MAG: metal-dependent hydrolase [bacterium]|nr:MAG: metal-dependent hydrolase [bacterium]